MKKREIRSALKTVYQELWALLSLFEETEFYYKLPKGEKEAENADEDAVGKYVEERICGIKKCVDSLFLGEKKIAGKLNRIIDETECFVNQCSIPGVVTRWKRINPQLIYFDCAFDVMEKCPKFYLEMCRGLTNIHLSCYPDSELVAKRKAYFERIREENKLKNIEYSEERIFQNELLNTLTLLFENDFMEYL